MKRITTVNKTFIKPYCSAPCDHAVFRDVLDRLYFILLHLSLYISAGGSYSYPGRFVKLLPAGGRAHRLAPGSCPSLSRAQACCGWNRPHRNPRRMHGSGASAPPPRTAAYSRGTPSDKNVRTECDLTRSSHAGMYQTAVKGSFYSLCV